jgi:hypothetical protein
MAVEKLSLRRGEVLMLASDGVESGAVDVIPQGSVDGPLGSLAEYLLNYGSDTEADDATVALIRLRLTKVS